MCFITINYGVAIVATKLFLFLLKGAISMTFFAIVAEPADAVIGNMDTSSIIEHLGTDNPGPTATVISEVSAVSITDLTLLAPLPRSASVKANVVKR